MEEEKNIFQEIETKETPSNSTKNAVISELEFLQNTSHLVDLFIANYFKTLTSALSFEQKID